MADNARLIGAIGVLGFVIPAIGSVAAAPTYDFPATGSTAEQITDFVVDHRDALRAGVILDIVGVTLWGVFGVGLWVLLRSATGGESFLSACLLFGVVSMVTLLLAGFVCFLVLAYRAPDIADPRVLYDVTFGLLAVSGLPTAVAMGSYAGLVLGTGVLPGWTATIAAVGAGAHLALLASFVVTDGFFSLQGQVITVIPLTLFIWVLTTGIALLRAPPGPTGTRP